MKQWIEFSRWVQHRSCIMQICSRGTSLQRNTPWWHHRCNRLSQYMSNALRQCSLKTPLLLEVYVEALLEGTKEKVWKSMCAKREPSQQRSACHPWATMIHDTTTRPGIPSSTFYPSFGVLFMHQVHNVERCIERGSLWASIPAAWAKYSWYMRRHSRKVDCFHMRPWPWLTRNNSWRDPPSETGLRSDGLYGFLWSSPTSLPRGWTNPPRFRYSSMASKGPMRQDTSGRAWERKVGDSFKGELLSRRLGVVHLCKSIYVYTYIGY